MNIYLIGYMYAGKTTFGRRLAAERGMLFLDLDEAFEQRYHYTVPMFFDRFGEPAFRQLERQLLHSTASLDGYVISTGGGTPCQFDNMDFLLSHGRVVYLQMSVDDLVARGLRSRHPRARIHGMPEPQLREHIRQHLAQREPTYLRAHYILDGLHPELPPAVATSAI